MATKDLNVILGLRIENFQKNLSKAQRSMNKFGRDMERLGSNLTQALTLPILGAGGAAVASAVEFEQLEARLRVLTGSAEAGAAVFERIKKFAASTPFEVGDLVEASSQLMAFGFAADEALDSLQYLGDIAAATGSNINDIALILGQARTVGVAFTQDLRQLASRGIPVFEMLQEQTGLTGKAFNKFVADGGVTFEVLNDILRRTASEGGKFFGGMEMQSKTLGGALSNFKDAASIAFAELGSAIAESTNLNERLRQLSDLISALVQRFKELSPEAKQTAVNVALMLAAIGPATFVIGKFASIAGSLMNQLKGLFDVVKKFATFLLGVPGIIVATVIAITYLYNQSETARKVINGLVDSVASLVDIFTAGASAAELFFAMLRGDATTAGKAFVNMQNALNNFQKQVGEVNFDDAENRITASIDRIKEKISEALTLKPVIQPTTIEGQTTTVTGGGGGVDKMPSGVGLGLPDDENTGSILTRNQDLLKGYYDIYINSIDTLMQQNENRLAQEQELLELEKQKQQGQTITNSILSATQTITDSLFNAMEQGKNVFKSLTNSIKQMVVQLIKAVAQAALFSAILSLIPGGSFVGKLLGSVGLTTGKGSFGANFKGMLGLASGGLVTGPTMALVGEGSGTSISNPEVVAPLDKLRSMLGNMNQSGYIAETRIQGSDLLLSIERAERNRNR
jgi:tape measure domain-containing protein